MLIDVLEGVPFLSGIGDILLQILLFGLGIFMIPIGVCFAFVFEPMGWLALGSGSPWYLGLCQFISLADWPLGVITIIHLVKYTKQKDTELKKIAKKKFITLLVILLVVSCIGSLPVMSFLGKF